MLVQDTIPSFIQGVSQQTPALRLPTQLEAQLNAVPDPVDGLRKRGSLRFLNVLLNGVGQSYTTHFTARDRSEQYIVTAFNGDLKVFDRFTGQEKLVVFPNGKTYLNTPNPERDLKFTSVADFTFISNRQVTVQMTNTVAPAASNTALINVRQGAYNARYAVYIDGVIGFEHVTSANQIAGIQTDAIAEALRVGLAGNLAYTVQRTGPTLSIRRNDGQPMVISTFSSVNEQALVAINGAAQRFTDLPVRAPNGYVVEIVGDRGLAEDNYYVRFVASNPTLSISEGYWEETVKPGLQTTLNPATMPHVLVREANGDFTFRQASWEPRKVGDDISNALPSFVGNTIQNVLFHQNRLGFLSGNNTIFSRTGEYFDFFVESARTPVDSDPIDVGVASKTVTELNHAIEFNEFLLLFSDQSQISMTGGETFTPTSVSFSFLSKHESNPLVAPVNAGDSVFFVTGRGRWATIQEFRVDDAVAQKAKSEPVTEHVPRYIPAGIRSLTASDSEKTLVISLQGEQDRLLVYNWYWAGRQREQSAWHEFRFNGAVIRAADFFESKLYIIAEKGGKTSLFTLDMSPTGSDEGDLYETHMDYKMNADDVQTTVIANKTRITLPFPMVNPVVYGVGPSATGVLLKSTTGTVTQIDLDAVVDEFWVGEQFTYSFTVSEIYYRFGEAQRARQNGHLKLDVAEIRYYNTGKFGVEILNKYGGGTGFYPAVGGQVNITGSFVGTGSAILGQPALGSGNIRFLINNRSDWCQIRITDSSVFPVNILSMTWFGQFIDRQRG